jgi:hypothetical protein
MNIPADNEFREGFSYTEVTKLAEGFVVVP